MENTYGIPIRIRDVPNPFTGDLDGARDVPGKAMRTTAKLGVVLENLKKPEKDKGESKPKKSR